MRTLIPVLLMLIAGVAHADTPISTIIATDSSGGGALENAPSPSTRLALGQARGGSVDRMHVAIVKGDDGPHLRWTLDVSTRSREPIEVLVPLEVSRDVAIMGFDLAITGQPEFQAVTMSRGAARLLYKTLTTKQELLEDPTDPALLEIVSTDGKTDQLQLRMFPIARDAPGSIVIDMAIPGGNELNLVPGSSAVALEIEDGSNTESWKRSKTPRSWPVRAVRLELETTAPTLTRAVSLVAGPWIASDQTAQIAYWRSSPVPEVRLSDRVAAARLSECRRCRR
jgi:hypothetical protein